MRPSQEFKLTWYIFACSILVSLGMSLFPAFTLHDTFWISVSIGLALVLVASRFLLRYLDQKKRGLGVFLTLAVLNLMLVVPELSLRIARFHYESGVKNVREFGYPTRREYFSGVVPDEKLFWRYRRNSPEVNSWGFMGREIRVPKESNTYRIVFLGDSCMEQGYPYRVEEILNERCDGPGKRVESVSLAVSGYSSYQGKVLAELYGKMVAPDLAVVCYGWNDHWLAWNTTDSQKVIKLPTSVTEKAMTEMVHRFRLLQLCQWLLSPVSSKLLDEVRVPEEEYRQNLIAIGSIFSDLGCNVIFMTAPTAAYKTGLGYDNSPFSLDENKALRLHKRYNEVVREVAQTGQGRLLDLEAEFNSLPNVESLFIRDKIHYTPAGLAFLARRLSEFILKHVQACDKSSGHRLPPQAGNLALDHSVVRMQRNTETGPVP